MNDLLALICRTGNSATTIVSIGAFSFAILFLILSVYRTDLKIQSLKIFASLLILSIATLAQNWAVYFLSVLVIATLITELNFLENIAAIVTNRDWWKLDKATKEEIQQQTKKELPPSRKTQRVVMETVASENEILNDFIKLNLFENGQIHRGVVLRSPQDDKFLFDALITDKEDKTHFITDVSIRTGNDNLLKFIQLKSALPIYRSIVPEKVVKGIFITLSTKEVLPYESEDILILKYNNSTKKFENLTSIKRSLKS